jgi:hypothetical protein
MGVDVFSDGLAVSQAEIENVRLGWASSANYSY